MIDKNTEISISKLTLFPVQEKSVKLRFNGDCISSDGGLLLLVMRQGIWTDGAGQKKQTLKRKFRKNG